MPSRKIVYVIVEGPSDDTALGAILANLYDKNSVYVEITHGDITSSKGIRADNIVSKIGILIKRYAASNHYTYKDFQEIIHIVDTDGVYIPDRCVLEDVSSEKVMYYTQEIRCSNQKAIIKRNKDKSDILNRLIAQNVIWKVLYKVYYMSCNLDHVLYNKQNSTDEEKENKAYAFALRYKNDIHGFLSFISKSSFSVNTNYKDSWNFIKEESRSLQRYSNISLAFSGVGILNI